MAITYVRDTGYVRSPTASVMGNFATLPSAGNFIGCCASGWDATGLTSLTASDNQGGSSYLSVVGFAGGLNRGGDAILYRENITAPSGTFTITFAQTLSSEISAIGVEFSGVATSSSKDVSATTNAAAAAGANTLTVTTAATVNGNALVMSTLGTDVNQSLSSSATQSGYNSLFSELDDVTYNPGAGAYKIVNTGGSAQSCSWVPNTGAGGSGQLGAAIVVFLAAAGGAAAQVPYNPTPLTGPILAR